jgi:hypothetical protein
MPMEAPVFTALIIDPSIAADTIEAGDIIEADTIAEEHTGGVVTPTAALAVIIVE